MKNVIRFIKGFIYEEGLFEALFVLIFGILMFPFLLVIAILMFIDDLVRKLCEPDD